MIFEEAFNKVNPQDVGGRKDQALKMLNHHKAIATAKPSLNTRIKPHPHVDAGKQKKPLLYKQLQSFGNVYKTFKAIAETDKGIVDDKKPQTMNFKHMNMNSSKPQYRQNKQQKLINFEHEKRLQNQQRIMGEIGSWAERKKNNWDCIAHPVILLRKEEEIKQKNDTNKMNMLKVLLPETKVPVVQVNKKQLERAQSAKPRPQNQAEGGQKIQEYRKKLDEELKYFERPLTAVYDHDKRNKNQNKEIDIESDDFIHEIPKRNNDREEDYQYIKVELIKIIIKYRLFKMDDLKSLFGRTLLHNQHLEIEKLDEIQNEIISELEN